MATPLTFDESSMRQMSASMDRASRRDLVVALRRMADSLEDTIGTIHRYGHIVRGHYVLIPLARMLTD